MSYHKVESYNEKTTESLMKNYKEIIELVGEDPILYGCEESDRICYVHGRIQ